MQKIQTESTEFKEKSYRHKFDDILGQFDSAHQQAILRARNERFQPGLQCYHWPGVSLTCQLKSSGMPWQLGTRNH